MKYYNLTLLIISLFFLVSCKDDPCIYPEGVIAPQGSRIAQITKIKSSLDDSYLQFIDNNNGMMLADDHTLLKTKDGGKSWVKYPILENIPVSGLYFSDTLIGYAQINDSNGSNLKIAKTIDGGLTWKVIKYERNGYFSKILENDNFLYTVVSTNNGSSSILRSNDNARTWEKINDFTFQNSTFFSIKNNKIYILSYPNIIICDMAGQHIENMNMPLSVPTSFFAFDDENLIIGNTLKSFKTNDGGKNWIAFILNKESQKLIHFTDKDNGLMISSEYCSTSDSYKEVFTIDQTTLGGDEWIAGETFLPTSFDLKAFEVANKNDKIMLLFTESNNQKVLVEISVD